MKSTAFVGSSKGTGLAIAGSRHFAASVDERSGDRKPVSSAKHRDGGNSDRFAVHPSGEQPASSRPLDGVRVSWV
jgi:hypothetical protein